jgi:phytoene/squalene synthetase
MEPSTTTLGDAAETAADAVASTTERVREELEGTERWVREIVRRHPVTCFLAAVAGGYLIGRIARRL